MILKRIFLKIARIIKLDVFGYKLKFRIYNQKCSISSEYAYKKLYAFHPKPESTPITNNVISTPKYDLTIIIPAYNAERWIEECLDSVLNQKTKYKYKVIVINDGSTDNTSKLINKYKIYSFFKIINQDNRGYSGARNIALKVINSKYIMFLDSDDILDDDAIEVLLNKAFDINADIVEGSAHAFNEKGIVYSIVREDKDNVRNNLWGAPWLKVIKSELFKNLEFPIGYIYEDTIISFLLFPQAKSISTVSKIVYNYRIHENSITQSHTNNPNRIDSFWIMLLVHEVMPFFNIEIDYNMYRLTMRHIVFTYRRCILLDETIKEYIFVLTRDFLIHYYGDYLTKNDEFKILTSCILDREFKRYSLICKNIDV